MERWKRVAVGLAILSLILLAGNGYWMVRNWQRTVVISVSDGDSLDLADGRRIRLLGIDSPEKGRCMADEARAKLVEVAQGKHVRLKDVVKDDFGRQLAIVIVDGEPLQETLVSRGLARNRAESSNPYYRVLTEAQEVAKSKKRGIWSDACRGKEPLGDCAIKGNVRAGEKRYYPPSCAQYEQVIVDTSFGDVWFCSEGEASRAGFALAPSRRN